MSGHNHRSSARPGERGPTRAQRTHPRDSKRWALLAALIAGVGSSAPASLASLAAAGHLGVCFYVTDNDSAATENVEIAAPGEPGAKGSLLFKGLGLNQSVTIKLNRRGVALSSFPVSESGSATVVVTLLTTPRRTRTVRITLQSASGLVQQNGCVPR